MEEEEQGERNRKCNWKMVVVGVYAVHGGTLRVLRDALNTQG